MEHGDGKMICEKTGCHAYIEAYGEYLYGDLFRANNVYLMRVCQISHEPLGPRLHAAFRGNSPMQWFDKDKTSGEQNSTLVFTSVVGSVWFDYAGEELK